MIGAIYGDIVGSVFEFNNLKSKDFDLFCEKSRFTDDTVMTLAVANALVQFDKIMKIDDIFTANEPNRWEDPKAPWRVHLNLFKTLLISEMHKMGDKYPRAGYGSRFRFWLREKHTEPYESYGNGSAMRVSPVAWYTKSLEEAIDLAEASAYVTHNHPEGIKGAVVTAGSIYLARTGATMGEIKSFVGKYYEIDFTLDDIRQTYEFNESCQGTVPQAMQAFFESVSFEDAIRNAISIGGDSDTLAAITGAVAEAYYGMTENEVMDATKRLDPALLKILTDFRERFVTE
jgi:type I restriction enzyme M protein